jgi:poly(A) polymerase
MSKMKLESFLEKCPLDLQKRIQGLKLVNQRPDFHPEGDVWIHTKIVFNRLAIFNDRSLLWAALFHDIGKDITTKKNDKGVLQAIGHEEVSGDLVKVYGPQINEIFEIDWVFVEEIVRNHMRIKQFDKMGLNKQLEMRRLKAFGYLQLFTDADDMGSLTEQELLEACQTFQIPFHDNRRSTK